MNLRIEKKQSLNNEINIFVTMTKKISKISTKGNWD